MRATESVLTAFFLLISTFPINGNYLMIGVKEPCVPYLIFMDSPQKDLKDGRAIKIGLLIQNKNCAEARNGAEFAVYKANLEGRFKGYYFELVVESMEGPWGAGSKKAVDLIFNDGVFAIVGSHDGRNAHLVEQVTTKANIVFLSAWTGDPTLSQAFTPWFFNCVPNDNQQAEILIYEIYIKHKFSRITIVVDDDYDANSAFNSFRKRIDELDIKSPFTVRIDKSVKNVAEIAAQIGKTNAECLLLFTEPRTAGKILTELKILNHQVPVYGPLYLLNETSPISRDTEVKKNLLSLSSGDWLNPERSDFAMNYHNIYGCYPGAAAAYSYDAMTAIINAIKLAGAEKEKIRQALSQSDFTGTTGRFSFDGKGNRILTGTENK